jgi:cysteine desulfurase/selenocysteine lyase
MIGDHRDLGKFSSRRYFDNAATSFPKAPNVAMAMQTWTSGIQASPGRAAYAEVTTATECMHSCRANLCSLIGTTDPSQIIFTLNCTDALSLAIEGRVRAARRTGKSIHIVTTAMDHNSVLRPLRELENDGISWTCVAADPHTGLVCPDDIAAAITADTRLVAVNHGSNVTGTIQAMTDIGDRCRHADVPLLVDAAQTLGHRHIDVHEMGIDLLAFPGHKGLLGPLGTGGLWIRPGLEELIAPVRLGGTGSRSEEDVQPTMLPDRYESGSHNMLGIIGLEASTEWIRSQSLYALIEQDLAKTAYMLESLLRIDGLRVHGPHDPTERCGVFAVTINGCEPDELARRLDTKYGILTRAGIHCAPYAHATIGTLSGGGAVRLSLGAFTTSDDINAATEALTREAAALHCVGVQS